MNFKMKELYNLNVTNTEILSFVLGKGKRRI